MVVSLEIKVMPKQLKVIFLFSTHHCSVSADACLDCLLWNSWAQESAMEVVLGGSWWERGVAVGGANSSTHSRTCSSEWNQIAEQSHFSSLM